MLALDLPSYPPYPQAGVEHGAIIAILATRPRAMHFGGGARARVLHARPKVKFCPWRPGHFVGGRPAER